MSTVWHLIRTGWHRFAMQPSRIMVPGVSAAPQPPANGWQPFGLARGERLSVHNGITGKIVIGSEDGSVYCFGVKN
jgi:hypothetical protein